MNQILFNAYHFRIATIPVELHLGRCLEFHDTGLSGIKRIIACANNALSGKIFCTALADDDLAKDSLSGHG